MSLSQEQSPILAESRDYICPCGKTYLSYPALFTHIKQKHGGKAPGEIQKPKSLGRPRGRPPKRSQNCPNKNKEGQITSRETLPPIPNNSVEYLTYRIQFEKIFHNLQQIVFPEEISPNIWEQVYSFRHFEKFMDQKKINTIENKELISIGVGLSEFLRDVSVNTESFRFQQLLVLFMLLLQYVLDQSNNPKLIQTAPIDYLVQYMNPFINSHIIDYSQFLGIRHLWIIDTSHMHQIFLSFYNWLKWKDYTNFCITLID